MDLLLIMDHRQVSGKVAPCSHGRADGVSLKPYQPVFCHLGTHLIEEFPAAGKGIRPFKDGRDRFFRDMPVFNGQGCNLVCQDIGRVPGRDDVFNLACLCPPCNDQGLEQIIESQCKDGTPGYGMQLMPGPADSLDQAGDLPW